MVDYKTDAVGDEEELTRAMLRYRLQGATYSLAVERALGRPVSRCVFLFLRGETAIQREVPDLRLAIDEVERLVRAVSDEAQGRASRPALSSSGCQELDAVDGAEGPGVDRWVRSSPLPSSW